jgi:hypothetical protein
MITVESRAETAMRTAVSSAARIASSRPFFPLLLFPEPDFFFGAAETFRGFAVILFTYHHYRQIRVRPFAPGGKPQPRARSPAKKRPPQGGPVGRYLGLYEVDITPPHCG